MISIHDLQTALLDLLFEIRSSDIKLIIGGGFGIYLKADYVRRREVRTLFREKEWRYALELRDQHKDESYVKDAGRLVSEYFSALDRMGIIRLMESRYFRPEMQLDEFITALQEIFPANAIN